MKRAKTIPLIVLVFLASGLSSAQYTSKKSLASDVIALASSADLVAKDLGFTALGEITFTLLNRGDVGINVSQKPAPPQTKLTPAQIEGGASTNQIKIDIHMGGTLIQSVYQPSLAGKQSRVFKVKPVTSVPRCAESRSLKVVVDPQNTITELFEDNNVVSGTVARPCPDLAVESIKKNFNDWRTEYVAEVKLINKGNIASPRFRYLADSINNSLFTSLPDLDHDIPVDGLAPGQTKKFTIGSAFAYEKMRVRVMIDRLDEIRELDESNNFQEKVLD